MRLSISAILFAALSGACVASGGYDVNARIVAPVPTAEVVVAAPAPVVYEQPQPVEEVYVAPDLVEVSPGIQVIADYNEPVFYSNNLYWRNDGGIWYSSSVHTGGWARAEAPEHIRGISRPAEYSHYRPAGYVPREQRPGYRAPTRVVEHREPGYREPTRVEPTRTGPTYHEPTHVEPTRTGPTYHEPTRTEPVHTAPTMAHPEPTRTGPTYTAPAPAPTYRQPTAAQPPMNHPNQVAPSHTAPAPAPTYHAPPPAAHTAPSAAHPAPARPAPKKKN